MRKCMRRLDADFLPSGITGYTFMSSSLSLLRFAGVRDGVLGSSFFSLLYPEVGVDLYESREYKTISILVLEYERPSQY